MDEKEELEFHKVWDQLCDDGYRSAYEAARKCWVEAKRSQAVVELPKPSNVFDVEEFYSGDVYDALNAAGIQYRIKGE